MMGKIGYALTLPLLGGIRLVRSLAGVIDEVLQAELLDDDALRGELLELQHRLDAREIDEGDYERLEALLLERLETARAHRERRAA